MNGRESDKISSKEEIEKKINEVKQRRNKCKRNHKEREEEKKNEIEFILKIIFNE